MKISILNYGKTYEIEIEENNSIQELKETLEKETKIPSENIILRAKEGFLFEKTIKENNIKEDSTIILMEVKFNQTFNLKSPNCGNFKLKG